MTEPDGAPGAARAPNSLYLVDGSGFVFRAFHALPPLTRPDGHPVNAVYGFCAMLSKLLAELGAAAVAVVFDAKGPTFRNQLFPAYKANRDEPPPELIAQLPLIRDATAAFEVPAIEQTGFEADDLIAAYTRAARAAGRPVVIVSSDKDLMQLVADGVEMYDPIKNRPIRDAEVREKFGVPPAQVVDVQALAGDSTDNVPGVPGIGVKTAAQLITEHGDLETLLGATDRIRQPKRRQSLIDHADQARLSRRLVLLDADAPLPVPLEALSVHGGDRTALLAFLDAQGFRSLATRVRQGAAPAGDAPLPAATPAATATSDTAAVGSPESAAAAVAPPVIDQPVYEIVTDLAVLDGWVARAIAAGVVAVDTETTSLTPATTRLVGLSLAIEPGHACYVPVGHTDPDDAATGTLALEAPAADRAAADRQAAVRDQPGAEAVMARLTPLLEDPSVLKVGHNLKFDLQVFAQYGVTVAPLDDTMQLSYVVGGGGQGHGMDDLAARHLGVKTITYGEVAGTGKARVTFDKVPIAAAGPYAAEDADITLRLHRLLKPRLVAARRVALYETIERPLVPVVAAMERAGVLIDRDALAALSRSFADRLATLEDEIHTLAGRSFNVGSPKQLGEILFGDLGLPGGRKLKTGGYSTDSAVLEPLADQGIEIAAKVLDWRQLAKLKGTYTDSLQNEIDPKTGRVHTSFQLAATNTGRLASSDPNLQNIPIRTELGREIRRAFVAAPGCKLLSVDYSQIELRLVADIAGIAALRQAFQDGLDIHALTASQVFGVPLDQMTSELRRQAKAINFGIIYGISGYGLGKQLGIPPGDANTFIAAYLERYHELKRWMDETRAFARRTGHVLTRFGRLCPIAGIADKTVQRRNFAERQAINAPIQGTAADIIKTAMVRIPPALAAAGLRARMLLQVHDELVFEVPEDQADATAATVVRVMEAAATLSVPLVADAGLGDNWADAH